MSEGQGINVPITGDLSGLTSSLSEALGGIKAFTSGVNGAFGGLANAVGVLKGPFMALTGILAGGALFKGSIDAAKEWTGEVKRLAQAMNISLAEASAYKKAMDDLDISTDQMAGVSRMLTMRMQSAAKSFNEVGVSIIQAGKVRSTADVFRDIADKANKMTDAGEKNSFLFKTLGRSYQSYLPTLKLTAERIAEARKEVEDFGMVVSKDGIKRTEEYKIAMNNVGDAMNAWKVKLGNELMPILTTLAKELSKLGMEVFPYIRVGAIVIAQVFDTVIAVVKTLLAFVMELVAKFADLGKFLGGIGAAIAAAFSGDKAGAAKILSDTFSDAADSIEGKNSKLIDRLEGAWKGHGERLKARIADAMGEGAKPTDEKEKGGGGGAQVDMSAEIKDRAKQAHDDATLAAGRKLTIDEEIAFWGTWTETARAGGGLYKKAWEEWSLKMVDLFHSHQAEQVKDIEAGIDLETAYGDQTAANRFAAEEHKYQVLLAMGDGFEQQQKAQYQKLMMAHVQWLNEDKKLTETRLGWQREAAEASMQIESQALTWAAGQGLISEQESIARQAQFTERKLALKRDELDRLAVLYAEDSQRLAQIYQQMEMLKIEHEGAMVQIGQQSYEAQRKQIDQFVGPVRDAFQSMFDGIKQGGMNFGNIMRNLFVNLAKMVIQQLTTMVTQQIALGATAKAAKTAQAGAEITANAGVAASGAAASVASTPFAGPALAAAAFATVMGIVMGAMSLLSASGGYDLGNENPITQLHAKEMVLPAHLAERVRNMTEGGGSGGAPQNVAVHFNLSGMDGPSVYRTFKENEAQIVKALTEAVSTGRLRLGS